MSYYTDIYQLRINRYGTNYQERMQAERERMFSLYLDSSVYKVSFQYNNSTYYGSLEPSSQNETKLCDYLLVNVDLNLPNGTILMIPDKDNNNQPWMVYYLENLKASGYNRYIVVKMTHQITWNYNNSLYTSWAYMYGQEDNMLKNELKSRSRSATLYNENLKLSFFLMPKTQYLRREQYILIGEEPFKESYRVTGIDIQSTDGVMYVSLDPVYNYDETPAPTKQATDTDSDFYWIEGGR